MKVKCLQESTVSPVAPLYNSSDKTANCHKLEADSRLALVISIPSEWLPVHVPAKSHPVENVPF